jgi:phage shock protein PspC (stress-responsive transcriptional regulator)
MTTTPPPQAPPGPTAPPPPGPGPHRDELRDLGRLRRSRSDRHIAGVAGGLARHFDVDPVIPRVTLAVLVFFGGAGLLVYVAIWLLVPYDDRDEATLRLDERNRGIALALAGVLAVLSLLGHSLGGWGPPWPLVLVGAVVLVVLLARDRGGRRGHDWGPGVPAGAYPTTPTTPAPSAFDDVHRLDAEAARAQARAAATPRRPRRTGPVLFWYALALITVGLGALGVADLAGADVTPSAYPALALGVTAVLLVLGSFWGRPGGLILLGLVTAVATAGATVAHEVDAGRLEATPASAAEVQDRYALTVGEIDLDLSRVVDPENLDGRTVEVDLDFAGRIEVTVPRGVDVVVRSDLQAGQRTVLGTRDDESGSSTVTDDAGPDAPELTLDLSLELGEIVVLRGEDTPR